MPKQLDETLSVSNTNNLDDSMNEEEFILPRSAWNDKIAYFRVLFRVKRALDCNNQKN
jgi:hypothetical protein